MDKRKAERKEQKRVRSEALRAEARAKETRWQPIPEDDIRSLKVEAKYKYGYRSAVYWNLFREVDMKFHGAPAIVNDIPVTDPDFIDLVLASVEVEGKIVTRKSDNRRIDENRGL